MTTEALRVLLDDFFCGCGEPEQAAAALLLTLRDSIKHRKAGAKGHIETNIPDSGTRYLFLYLFDQLGLTEHGTGISSFWLTELGNDVLGALERELAKDGFASLFTDRCAHGFLIDGDTEHNCFEGAS